MYKVSDEFRKYINGDSRTFFLSITAGVEEFSGVIESMTMTGGSNGDDDIAIGSAVSQYVEIKAHNAGLFVLDGREIFVQIGAEIKGEKKYIPLGYFTPLKPTYEENTVSFVAYDRMLKLEKPLFLNLPEITTTKNVLREIGFTFKISINYSEIPEIQLKRPDGYTAREVISYIAGLYGCFAVFDRNGVLQFKWYENAEYDITPNRYWDNFSHNDFPFEVSKVECFIGKSDGGEDISIIRGNGARGIVFTNPFATEEVVTAVWEKLEAFTYMPGEVNFLGDPCIDPWDIMTVTGIDSRKYRVPAMKIVHEYDGGLSTTLTAVGKTEEEQENGFKGPMTKEMERQYTQLVLIDKAMVNKLDVETAREAELAEEEEKDGRTQNQGAKYNTPER